MLDVQSLARTFFDPQRGEIVAVDSLSFSCQGGEIFGLLGPNGAGKTTTLRLIATILKPESGSIAIDNIDALSNPEEARKKLGFLSSDTGLYERMTAREILLYFGDLCAYPAADLKERVQTVIGLLRMQAFADTRCEKLSAGMRQRVSIARAIVHDPPLLVLDEPCSGLDVLGIKSMHDFIRSCKAQGKCVVFSTHEMSEAERLCDRIGILHKGRLFALGTLDELRAQTEKHYLEDIFLTIVGEQVDEF